METGEAMIQAAIISSMSACGQGNASYMMMTMASLCRQHTDSAVNYYGIKLCMSSET